MDKSTHTKEYALVRAELKAAREGAQLSQRALAARLGIPHSWVAKVEAGERRIDIVELCWILAACEKQAPRALAELGKKIAALHAARNGRGAQRMNTPLDDNRRAVLLRVFRMPSVQTMVSRKSSITNAFVTAVLPAIVPTVEEIDQALIILCLDPFDLRCAYCGDCFTEWDHLRPLVDMHRPTGFISEIANLVPSCGKCNQSKRNVYWRDWMLSNAPRSPTGRSIADVALRVERLEAYERWRAPTKLDFERIIGREEWEQYWALWEAVNGQLKECQKVADALKTRITANMIAAGKG